MVREKLRHQPVGPEQEAGEHHARTPRPAGHLEPAHRHRGLGRVSGEQVGDRDAVVGEEPAPGARARLDDGGVLGSVGHQHPAEVAVVPPERRHAVGRAHQDRLLAGRGGARAAGRVHSWTACDPASTHRRSVGMLPDCSTHCMTGKETPSSWTNTTPSTSGSGILPGLDAQQAGGEGLVGAGAGEPHEQRSRRRPRSRPRRRPSQNESNDAPGTMVDGDLHHDRLPEQRGQGDGDPADRGGELDQERPHDHADQPVDGGGGEQRLPRRVGEAGSTRPSAAGRGRSGPR